MRLHHYQINLTWTGNKGEGTKSYKAYNRNHTIAITGKEAILGSSDPAFRGDKTRHNPEDLFVSSVAACHMLWYLHLCAAAGVEVLEYSDNADGTMTEIENGAGRFTEITLNPLVVVADYTMVERAKQLHQDANKMCFIANSCNFPIKHKPVIKTVD